MSMTIQDINKQIAKLQGMKKAAKQDEIDRIMSEGLSLFANDRAFRKIDVRLLGSSYYENGFNKFEESEHKADFVKYRKMCHSLQKAIDNLETFYSRERHIPIIQGMIDNPIMQNKKSLLRIFRKALISNKS